MKTQKAINVFLKDDKENLYRIFKISHEKDKYGENYFKVMLPDLIGKQLNTNKTSRYVKPSDLKKFLSSELSLDTNEFHEYTYHYESGIAHFKNNKGNYLYQIKNLPKLQDNRFLNFIRFIIHDLNKFKIYNKQITEKDLILKLTLNDFGRLLNLYLLEDMNVRIINDDERVGLIGSYTINVKNTKKYLVIQEFCYAQPQLKENRISFGLFVFNNTTINLIR